MPAMDLSWGSKPANRHVGLLKRDKRVYAKTLEPTTLRNRAASPNLHEPNPTKLSKMRLFSLILPVFSLLSSTARAESVLGGDKLNVHSITLHKWPLSAVSPVPLGAVTYNPGLRTGNFEVAKAEGGWSEIGDEDVVRVGVWDGEGGWFGCVTAGKSLKDPSTAVIVLRLDEAGKVWHVEYLSSESSTAPTVKILRPTPGPQPHLNKPIVLTPDGKIPVQEVEKTFLQKYWWMLLGATLLIMTSGGGGE